MKRIIAFLAITVLLSACGVFSRFSRKAKSPSEDVVNIGYGTEVRGNLTSSVSSVPINDNQPVYRTIYEMIEGKCPGVTVEGDFISIRGAEEEPLFVVDGTPHTDIDWINPSDVKSITVLKDAGSTAIYGLEGANGVILIDLK